MNIYPKHMRDEILRRREKGLNEEETKKYLDSVKKDMDEYAENSRRSIAKLNEDPDALKNYLSQFRRLTLADRWQDGLFPSGRRECSTESVREGGEGRHPRPRRTTRNLNALQPSRIHEGRS